jgi:ABC-type glycerol-3-phosphate transport system substrate-binding protein
MGCKPPAEDVATEPKPVRIDVPLRVLLCGNQRWADTLNTAWSAIAEQPLQFSLLDPEKNSADQWQAAVLKGLETCDVGIVSTGLIPAIESIRGLTPPNADLLDDPLVNAESFYPVLREGPMKFGAHVVAVPLGAIQPALVARTDAATGELALPADWEAYLDTLKQLGPGTAAEPLADGAAAKMFLWRASASNPPVWLFDRESFAPIIDSEPYVRVLETMKQCCDLYGDERLTAGEVWQRVATGKLRMAIAWPAAHSTTDRIEEAVDCQFGNLPTTQQARESNTPAQCLVDYESPVAILSSHCRQSEAAKRFITWMVGGEGTSMVQDSVTGLTDLRSQDGEEPGLAISETDGEDAWATTYEQQAKRALSVLAIRPPLQLLEYRQYAAALDAAVLSCLDGKQSAQAALAQAASQWSSIHQKVDLESQSRVWRKTRGLRG